MIAQCIIPLTRGLETIVDPGDFEELSNFNWYACQPIPTQKIFYAQRSFRVDGVKHHESMHRRILGCTRGDGLLIDHKNGNSLDNRRDNLRIATRRNNMRNTTSSPNQKAGGFKGVHWNRGVQKWSAQIRGGAIRSDGRLTKLHLGNFENPADAAMAYDVAARDIFGEFASCNFPESKKK